MSQSKVLDLEAINNLAGKDLPVFDLWQAPVPQSAYLMLTENGGVYADTEFRGGGIPMEIHHERTLIFDLSPKISGDDIIELVRDNLDELEDVYLGHSVKWDGHNYVGVLTDKAQSLRDSLVAKFTADMEQTDKNTFVYNSVSEYLAGNSLSEYWPNDQCLEAAIAAVYRNNESCYKIAFTYDDIHEYMLDEASEILKKSPDDLHQVHFAGLLEHRGKEVSIYDMVSAFNNVDYECDRGDLLAAIADAKEFDELAIEHTLAMEPEQVTGEVYARSDDWLLISSGSDGLSMVSAGRFKGADEEIEADDHVEIDGDSIKEVAQHKSRCR